MRLGPGLVLLLSFVLLRLSVGCGPGSRALTATERAVEDAARPILEMGPDAVWTASYNRLLDLAPASIAYLAEHPRLCRPAAPDDLRVLLHTGLLRLLLHPATRPRLSGTCLETTLAVLHFDLKVEGHPVGTPGWPQRRLPATWHELYPADFDHALADRIDAEADRLVMRRWWEEYRDRPHAVVLAPRLEPRADDLWALLARRWADRWTYQPEPRSHVVRCTTSPPEAVMIFATTYDYNVVRAACVWLGASGDPDVRDHLISLVGSPSPVVAHNALLALRYVPDERIRNLLERYKDKVDRTPPDTLVDGSRPLLTRM